MRRSFRERLARFVDAARGAGHKLALGLVDVDGFTTINDSPRAPWGDELLKQMRAGCPNTERPERACAVVADRFAVVLARIDARTTSRGSPSSSSLSASARRSAWARPVCGSQPRSGFRYSLTIGADADTLFKNAEAALKR